MKGFAILVLGVTLAIAHGSVVETGAKRCKGHEWTDVNQETNDYLLAHDKCTKFWSCTAAGDAYEMDCPSGLHFSTKTKRCEWPADAKCNGGGDGGDGGDSSSSSSSSESSSSESNEDTGSGRCKGHAWTEANQLTNDYLLPHSNCAKFWSCTAAGEAVEMNCPAGLHFSAKDKLCDYPANAKCS